ncbi:DUF4399 domain-containing protein [Reichenbachiella sp. MALMAid0571]|uniref:DUF4399 domain-containing protein n=1 Tax=Reichenbachiella sp. MALMAid0571 TaxID=3143939 RepID=UPI0032DE408B
MKNVLLTLLAGVVVLASCSSKKESKEPVMEQEKTMVAEVEEEPSVFFKSPADGATVASPVFIEMGVKGMKIEPAGQVNEGFGHHHILINQASWPEGQVIPASDSTIHFGKGQTDTSLELEPGEYTISLQFANGVHASYGEDMAASIKITVE